MDDNEQEAREMWRRFAQELASRGWHLSVGCGNVQIVTPGDGGPQTDQYVEVMS